MSLITYGIFGAGGNASELLPILKEQLNTSPANKYEIFFVDEDETKKTFCNLDVLTTKEFMNLNKNQKKIVLSPADSKVRERIVDELQGNIDFINLISRDFVNLSECSLGNGLTIAQKCIITSDVKLGNFIQINLNVSIQHNCLIEDYVTIAPSVSLMGNVKIGKHAYIGAGAVIKQGVQIGTRSTVGMGSVVVKDVPEDTIVYGNPAKPKNT